MKIKYDYENEAVVAVGYYKGQKIKAVSVCKDGDKFDPDFGAEMSKKKWKIKRTSAKISKIKQIIRELEKYIDSFKSDLEILEIQKEIQEEKLDEFAHDYFENLDSGAKG